MTRMLVLLALLLLGLPAFASAQTVLFSPTSVAIAEFSPAPGHNLTDLSGNPILVSYELNAMGMTSLGALAFTVNLGKPPINATGKIAVQVPGLVPGLTRDTLYTATLTSIGQGGILETSAPSNPFGVATGTPTPPGAATGLIIKRE